MKIYPNIWWVFMLWHEELFWLGSQWLGEAWGCWDVRRWKVITSIIVARSPSCVQTVKWPCLLVTLEWSCNDPGMTSKLPWNYLGMTLGCLWNDLGMTLELLEWPWNDLAVTLEWLWIGFDRNGIGMGFKWHWNHFTMTMECHWKDFEMTFELPWNGLQITLEWLWNGIGMPFEAPLNEGKPRDTCMLFGIPLSILSYQTPCITTYWNKQVIQIWRHIRIRGCTVHTGLLHESFTNRHNRWHWHPNTDVGMPDTLPDCLTDGFPK